MASERPTQILLSKTDLTKEQIRELSDSEAWSIIYGLQEKKEKNLRPQVCFTGFGSTRKKELSALAETHGFLVVGSVTRDLRALVAGDNAGPKKLEQAAARGAIVASEAEFIESLDDKPADNA